MKVLAHLKKMFSKEVKNWIENAMQIKTQDIKLWLFQISLKSLKVITANKINSILNILTFYVYITC